MTRHEPHCPKCGYTKTDALINGDHYLCSGKIPGWRKESTGVEARSGCSQGSPVPADTPQECVRSPRVSKDMLRGRLDGALWALDECRAINNMYAGLARAAQVVADTARALAEREGE